MLASPHPNLTTILLPSHAQCLRFFALLVAALSLTMESAHVLELPQKMRYDMQRYTSVNSTLSGFVAQLLGFSALIVSVLVDDAARRP
jgi:hypothetical protein